MKNRQNISLSRILNFYTSEDNLAYYQSMSTVKQQLKDIRTMFEFVRTNFIVKAQALKKKPDEYNSNHKKAVETFRDFTLNKIPGFLSSKVNQKLAYDVLAISTQQKIEIANNQASYNIEFEMKLKFLESVDVDPSHWAQFYDRLTGNLVIGDQKIKISVALIYPEKEYLWRIQSVQYMGKYNAVLTSYYQKDLIPWIRKNQQKGERNILAYIIKSVQFCESVLLFNSIEQKFWNSSVNKNFKLGDFKLQVSLQQKIYEFYFPKAERDDIPDFKIMEGQKEILRLPLDNNLVNGILIIGGVKLECDFISHKFSADMLVTFLKQIHHYENQVQQLIKQLDIQIKDQVHLIIKNKGNYWKSSNFVINDEDYFIKQTKQNGLYLLCQGQQSSVILKMNNKNTLISNYLPLQSINTLLKSKNYVFKQILYHVQLRNQIITNNHHFQYKINEMILNQEGSLYLFRDQKFFGFLYGQNNIQAFSRSERQRLHNEKIYEDFTIKIHISHDFTSIKFTSYCPRVAQFEIPMIYFNEEWKNYVRIKGPNECLIIKEIIQCLRYFLVHFRTFRFYETRVTQKDQSTIKIRLL